MDSLDESDEEYLDAVNEGLREIGAVRTFDPEKDEYLEVDEGTPQHVIDKLINMTDAEWDVIFKKSEAFIKTLHLENIK